jgi:signal transduction histidine kinase
MTHPPELSSYTQSKWWWLPLALIAAALILILAAPLATSTRLQRLRRHEGTVSAPALVWVNDLEAALGEETAARSEEAERTSEIADARASVVKSRAAAERDLRILDSLVREIGPDAISLLAEARLAIGTWQQEEDLFTAADVSGATLHGTVGSATRSPRWKAFEAALSKVQRLDDTLAYASNLELGQIARLEHFNGLVPAALVPLALLALAAVGWTARTTRKLSHEASAGRLAAERALDAKSVLMRGVTHDLRNPLGAARGYADLLADGVMGPVPDAQARTVARLRSLIDLTLDTVNDLLELSRADAGVLSIDRLETDIAAIAREVVDDYRASGDAAGVDLKFEIADQEGDAPFLLLTDPTRVRQVLGNLLSNAVKYTPRGGEARVCVAHGNDAALNRVTTVDVSDNGPGIPTPHREQVFEEFFRVPKTSTLATGTGVGLAIARRVARLLGGDLRFREAEAGGATFTLLLPERG